MRSESPQPSQIIFPVALQPVEEEVGAIAVTGSESWGWIEIFVLCQVFWGVLLFLPGSQAYRMYIRAFPYVTSIVALLACARSRGAELAVPGARWIVAALLLLVCSLTHPDTWLQAGAAQVVFQLAIAAPVFWAARVWISEKRLERLLWLVFGAHFVSAAVGLLQVYYPERFLPGQFSTLALQMNPEFIHSLTYTGAGDRQIVRPPGLSDLPGGAAISGTIAALLGFAFAMRAGEKQVNRLLYMAVSIVGITVVYLTMVRSMLLMVVGSMFVLALIRARQGRVVQSGWVAACAGGLVFGSFIWAVTVGGDVIQDRFASIVDSGVYETYQDNRGFFLDYTITELPFQYPFGAGVGRWGMMSVYFHDPQAWQRPRLHAEIQPTGWLFDGGLPMWIFYPVALLVAMRYTYRIAIQRSGTLNDFATMVFIVQLLIIGLCLTGPVFNTQIGVLFWLVTAILFGRERTAAVEEWNAQIEAEEAE
ncbi:MAG: hypothetical protein ND807_12340 [Vicinamibacterales bacterium]|nr:hypothetical protein [Vicinamibacterales bacterium]